MGSRYFWEHGTGQDGSHGWTYPGAWDDNYNEQRTATYTEWQLGPTCGTTSNFYTGTWTLIHTSVDSEKQQWWDDENGGDPEGGCYTYSYSYENRPAGAQWLQDGGWGWKGSDNQVCNLVACDGFPDANYNRTNDYTFVGVTQPGRMGWTVHNFLHNYEVDVLPTNQFGPGSGGTYTYTLMDEYTDDESRSNILALI